MQAHRRLCNGPSLSNFVPIGEKYPSLPPLLGHAQFKATAGWRGAPDRDGPESEPHESLLGSDAVTSVLEKDPFILFFFLVFSSHLSAEGSQVNLP